MFVLINYPKSGPPLARSPPAGPPRTFHDPWAFDPTSEGAAGGDLDGIANFGVRVGPDNVCGRPVLHLLLGRKLVQDPQAPETARWQTPTNHSAKVLLVVWAESP